MKIEFSETVMIPLTHPATGEPLKNDDGELVQIEAHSSQSKAFRKIKNAALSKAIAESKSDNDDLDDEQAAEKAQAASCQMLSDCTIALHGFEGLEIQGNQVTLENMAEVLDAAPWLKDQYDGKMVDTSLFFKSGSKKRKKR